MKPLLIAHLDDHFVERKRVEKAFLNAHLPQQVSLRSFANPQEFMQFLKGSPKVDILLLDVDLPQENRSGIEFIREVKAIQPQTVVFMYSGLEQVSVISAAMAAGADDFILKKEETSQLFERIFQSFEATQRKQGTRSNQQSSNLKPRIEVAGETMSRMLNQFQFLHQSAISCVYVEGETGTGKEVVAQVIESCLPPGTPFLSLNCAALTDTLLESELFGHKKGSFTGANQDKAGLIESANGGWLFLDEVSSLSSRAQSLLLRCIENQRIRRIGEHHEVPIQVKFVSASNEPLEALVSRGKFRGDLWQRLKEKKIDLPSLRDRKNEIPDLIQHFCERLPGGPYSITPAAKEVLGQYSWRDGNIRELRNVLRSMTLYSVNHILTPLCIPSTFWEKVKTEAGAIAHTLQNPPTPNPAIIQIPLESEAGLSYQHYSTSLFIELIRRLKVQSEQKNIKMSLRLIAQELDLSREVLSHRIRSLSNQGKITDEELNQWMGTAGRRPSKKSEPQN